MATNHGTPKPNNPGYSCPRYERCNAPLCPALGGHHMDGEPICFYMREAVKDGGEARVRAAATRELADLVLGMANALLPTEGPLPRALRKAAATGSKIEQGKNLKRMQEAA